MQVNVQEIQIIASQKENATSLHALCGDPNSDHPKSCPGENPIFFENCLSTVVIS